MHPLANVFLDRCLKLCVSGGVVQFVMPQNWLFLGRYQKQREHLLKITTWNLLARLGEHGFDSADAAGAFTILLTLTQAKSSESQMLRGLDASAPKSPEEKAAILADGWVLEVSQEGQLENPDARVALEGNVVGYLLKNISHSHHGLVCGDRPRMCVSSWEIESKNVTTQVAAE